ncbi:MAG: hypothetical protein E7513_06770 [Ruminococcaceae bacterium]|nr:hypothetical protein [Oscillospiraceae bacterium]
MSIADKILTLNCAKKDIANAIVNKGGAVSGGFSSFADDIAQIPSGVSDELLKSLVDGTIQSFECTATVLRNYSFYRCEQLEYICLINATSIGAYAFMRCSSLSKLIIYNENCELSNTDALSMTAISAGTGYIYVPDSAVEAYKNATNWNMYATQIKGISELEEAVAKESA